MAGSNVDDELWNEFHRVVNMTSRELRDWLAVQGAAGACRGGCRVPTDDVRVASQVVDKP